ncbi:MAG: hypothetical protein EHM23_06000 [Acidobacteria bacterium]|nr:MAG: hypothetical protein EHM23_06000 [Acidobacteriota bacterium]
MNAPLARSTWFPLAAILLGFSAYSWVLNNGFISDDMVFLDQSLDFNFLTAHLRSAPSAFRMTADLWFAAMQRLFGYQASWFYVFSILLHVLNAVLLRSLLINRGADRPSAMLASLLFVVIQNPAEAVAWLSAVNELLVGFFLLGVLWTAHRSHYASCLALYCAALISKESATVALLLLPLLLSTQSGRREKPPRWFWLGLGLLTVAYLAWFVTLIETNFLIQSGFYSIKPTAFLILAYSLHKLAFPWIYLALAFGLWNVRQSALENSERREFFVTAIWLVFALCPYIFLIYDIHVPSRHLYLAAMPGCYLMAQLIRPIGDRRLRWGFVVAFAIVNIAYLWSAKDIQYVRRGRTVHDLVAILRAHPPGCVLISDFPENPWVAKLSARLVPGWSPDMIVVNESRPSAVNCVVLKWDGKRKRYQMLGTK